MRRRPIKKPPVNIFKVLSIVLIVLFVISIPTVIKKLLIVQTVVCQSQIGPCPEEFGGYLDGFKGRDYKYSKDELNKFLSENYLVSDYLIQYQLPSTLVIDMVVKQPKYSIKSADTYFLIDENFQVLSLSNTVMPTVLNINNFSAENGTLLDDTIKNAITILAKLNTIYSTHEAILENGSLVVTLDNDIKIYLPTDGDNDALVGSVRLIYSRLNEENKGIRMEDVSEIDLRFQNPILRKRG